MAKVLALVFAVIVCVYVSCWTALIITDHPKQADGLAGSGVVLCILLTVASFVAWLLGDE